MVLEQVLMFIIALMATFAFFILGASALVLSDHQKREKEMEKELEKNRGV